MLLDLLWVKQHEYQKDGVYYEWMQEFKRQKTAASMPMLDLLEAYPREAVYAAMLDLVRKDYRRDSNPG